MRVNNTDSFLFVNFSRTLAHIHNDYVCFVEITVLQLFRANVNSARIFAVVSQLHTRRYLKINAIKPREMPAVESIFVASFETV